jgi:aminoglycoside/choline kinase family phosphotransferase
VNIIYSVWKLNRGAVLTEKRFAELVEHVAVQRCLKAVGTFAYMTVVYQRRQYLPYILPTLAYIKPLFERYEALRPLADRFRGYVPLLAM